MGCPLSLLLSIFGEDVPPAASLQTLIWATGRELYPVLVMAGWLLVVEWDAQKMAFTTFSSSSLMGQRYGLTQPSLSL